MNRRDFTKVAIAAPFVSSVSGTLKYEVREYEDSTEWYLDGVLHRHDGPAIEHEICNVQGLNFGGATRPSDRRKTGGIH